jgi:anaerobic ribonucleoside-triphosphate reductase activating protein
MNLIIGGIIPFTTIDYPNHLSMVVFLQGCPFRCPYCSNPELQTFDTSKSSHLISPDSLFDLIGARKNLLEAVVFSGGEASAQTDAMIDAINEIHKINPNYKIGLHTNGMYPDKLKILLPYLNWIGLDIKAPFDNYDETAGVKGFSSAVQQSLQMIIDSKISFECRTTCYPKTLSTEDILKIANTIKSMGVGTYAIQKFKPIDENKNEISLTEINKFFEPTFLTELKKIYQNVIVRD